jgi:hypothetical protein
MINRKSRCAMFVQYGSLRKRAADLEKGKKRKSKRKRKGGVITWDLAKQYFEGLEKRKINLKK